MDAFMDPGEPGELKGSLRAKDLINKPLLIQPIHEDRVEGQDGKPWHFVECNIAVIGMGGVEDHASGVRISWVRVLPQLTGRMKEHPGEWVGGIPKVQQDNSVILTPFSEKGRAAANEMMPKVRALFAPVEQQSSDEMPPPAYAPGEEPF
jgi:hypothetical protein